MDKQTNRPTDLCIDRPTDRRTNGPTDKASYRDAWTHLKKCIVFFSLKVAIGQFNYSSSEVEIMCMTLTWRKKILVPVFRCVFASLFEALPVCWLVSPSVTRSVCRSLHPSIGLSIRWSVCSSVYLSVCNAIFF